MKSVYSNGISLTILQMNILWLHLKFFIHSCCSVACSSHSYCKFQDCLIFLSSYTKELICVWIIIYIYLYILNHCVTPLSNYSFTSSLNFFPIIIIGFISCRTFYCCCWILYSVYPWCAFSFSGGSPLFSPLHAYLYFYW